MLRSNEYKIYNENGNVISSKHDDLLLYLIRNKKQGSFMSHTFYHSYQHNLRGGVKEDNERNFYTFVHYEGKYTNRVIEYINDNNCNVYIFDEQENEYIVLTKTSKIITNLMKIKDLSADEIAHNIQLLRDFIVRYVDMDIEFSENYSICSTKSARS